MVVYLIRGQLIYLRIKTDGALPLPPIPSLVSSAPSSCRVHGAALCIPYLSIWNPSDGVSGTLSDSAQRSA